jgi:hypothetical protein
MAMSQGVASVSTSCDDLGNVINERRIEDLDESPRLFALELALKNQNVNQGARRAVPRTYIVLIAYTSTAEACSRFGFGCRAG